jgi:SpoVK/Ycf46/Vps4 family AAA+-type ATPase
MPLTKADFDEAIKNINKSVSKDDLAKYQIWMEEFGSK